VEKLQRLISQRTKSSILSVMLFVGNQADLLALKVPLLLSSCRLGKYSVEVLYEATEVS
jgi:hypothetical protein